MEGRKTYKCSLCNNILLESKTKDGKIIYTCVQCKKSKLHSEIIQMDTDDRQILYG